MEEKLRLFRLQKNLESASTSQTDMTEEVVDESEEPLLAPKERTTPRKSDEVSAYSVFNPGCQRIEGTLSAEQFERELKYGAASVH
ncbi:uncharacterized protein LOC111623982 isoform X3 [Centruroides sculpturatus]|uniref:uncharacterized protein LOC111623982 isoform X3 n=1 Tax=Centruroides sculpturatus TaxID=218467 RepID=UPI000C6CC3FE|nr:uncharacterized protein LOC111623982 isoform X3 [Centruroides sculpturatus]